MACPDTYLLLGNIIAILILWLRVESRLSRLEGRFDQFINDRREVKK